MCSSNCNPSVHRRYKPHLRDLVPPRRLLRRHGGTPPTPPPLPVGASRRVKLGLCRRRRKFPSSARGEVQWPRCGPAPMRFRMWRSQRRISAAVLLAVGGGRCGVVAAVPPARMRLAAVLTGPDLWPGWAGRAATMLEGRVAGYEPSGADAEGGVAKFCC
jgi:hypothetical protein